MLAGVVDREATFGWYQRPIAQGGWVGRISGPRAKSARGNDSVGECSAGLARDMLAGGCERGSDMGRCPAGAQGGRGPRGWPGPDPPERSAR